MQQRGKPRIRTLPDSHIANAIRTFLNPKRKSPHPRGDRPRGRFELCYLINGTVWRADSAAFFPRHRD